MVGDTTLANATPVEAELEKSAVAHRILEMEGQGDMTLGHMSVRDPDGRGFWLKRKAIGMGQVVGPEDFVLLDFDGNQLAGDGVCHNEWPIHAEIMLRRPDVNAVGHTHPFYGCVFSASDDVLRPVALEGGYFWPDVPRYSDSYELINTSELGRGVAVALGDSFALLLKNHGVVFCGRSTEHAMLMAIFLERACRAQLVIGASGVNWSWPDETAMEARGPQTFHQGLIDRSWKFYNDKFKWARGLRQTDEYFRL